ncbi:uncharacterized protein LOC143257736 [Tachypleus tridentatus]|uniref:uncharacterized protein LOC143257736 n=1 Tax=Tachypleus tridentatus TaxID=6853 RepID=UPI003FD09029
MISCVQKGKLNNVSEVSRSRYYGRSWLLSTRNDRWGWGHQTHRAVISLYLNNRTEFSAGDLEDDLMVKELELQLAVALLGSHRKKLTAGQLALYVNGISATCGNPMNFFGIDLTKRLRHFQYTNSEFEYALVSLSLCHARKRLSKKRILHLLNQLRSTTDFNFLGRYLKWLFLIIAYISPLSF